LRGRELRCLNSEFIPAQRVFRYSGGDVRWKVLLSMNIAPCFENSLLLETYIPRVLPVEGDVLEHLGLYYVLL
jgi:hypothetical protein